MAQGHRSLCVTYGEKNGSVAQGEDRQRQNKRKPALQLDFGHLDSDDL
jgi:hypothetical protein